MSGDYSLSEQQTSALSDDQSAIPIENHDGFEAGDYRNFSPTYFGESKTWVRPTITITDTDPIAGNHSLQWIADEKPHEWGLISNGFSFSLPCTASVLSRADDIRDYSRSGLMLLETYESSLNFSVSPHEATFVIDDHQASTEYTEDIQLSEERVYKLELNVGSEGATSARLIDVATETVEVQFDGRQTDLTLQSLGLYLDSPAEATAAVTFDEVSVDILEYLFERGQWIRSPQFVVLPRLPDIEQDQGNWVGAHSMIHESGRKEMWYRIRNNENRGAGYGYATSEDGISWSRYSENPVFKPKSGVSSHEGISVLKVDNTYRAWYAVDNGETWHVALATSEDGIEWDEQGIVVEGYCKDPVVVYRDGVYFMYAIAPTNRSLAVYTSTDGVSWSRKNTFKMDSHRHPGAYYVEDPGEFHLYAFAEEDLEEGERFASETLTKQRASRVSLATSTDGINFSEFQETWRDPQVGLDDRPAGGIDYGRFLTDASGHLKHAGQTLMYYQARHNYNNNRPDWQKAGDGRVVLAGKFDGFFEGVPAVVGPEGLRGYRLFPGHADRIDDISLQSNSPCTVTLQRKSLDDGSAIAGTVDSEDDGTVTVWMNSLTPGTEYVATVNGTRGSPIETTDDGVCEFEIAFESGSTTPFKLKSYVE